MKLRSRVCPVCGSGDWSDVLVEANYDERELGELAFASRKTPEFMHFRMVRCPDCDLLYATPAPELEWLRENYRNAGFDAAEESRYAARTYARYLAPIAVRLPIATARSTSEPATVPSSSACWRPASHG